jgi:hypothetical protein
VELEIIMMTEVSQAQNTNIRAGGETQVVEHMPSMHKTLGSILSIGGKKRG